MQDATAQNGLVAIHDSWPRQGSRSDHNARRSPNTGKVEGKHDLLTASKTNEEVYDFLESVAQNMELDFGNRKWNNSPSRARAIRISQVE